MKSVIIFNAIIWAVVIIIASALYRDSENFIYLLGSLLAGFSLQNGITLDYLKRNKISESK